MVELNGIDGNIPRVPVIDPVAALHTNIEIAVLAFVTALVARNKALLAIVLCNMVMHPISGALRTEIPFTLRARPEVIKITLIAALIAPPALPIVLFFGAILPIGHILPLSLSTRVLAGATLTDREHEGNVRLLEKIPQVHAETPISTGDELNEVVAFHDPHLGLAGAIDNLIVVHNGFGVMVPFWLPTDEFLPRPADSDFSVLGEGAGTSKQRPNLVEGLGLREAADRTHVNG